MWTRVVLLVGVLGCGTDSAPADPTGLPDSSASEAIGSGEFQLYVESVDDECLDGSLALLFMPAGTGQPYALANPTWIPGPDALPATYVMDLEDPFNDMAMTVTARKGGGMQVRDALQSDVVLGLSGTGDCTADMSIDADFTFLDADTLDLRATVTLLSLTSAQEACPQSEPTPCAIHLTIRGERR